MQGDLTEIQNYMCMNRLTINVNKTKYMIFSSGFKPTVFDFLLELNTVSIERVSTFKYLGLVFDDKLNWRSHIDYIVAKINPMIKVLFRLRDSVPWKINLSVYFALIHSHFNYMSNVWGSCTQNCLKTLEILQKRALKILFKLLYLTLTSKLFNLLPVLPIKSIIF